MRKALEETNPVNTMISNCYSPELWENKCLFKSPDPQYFVMAVWETNIATLKKIKERNISNV